MKILRAVLLPIVLGISGLSSPAQYGSVAFIAHSFSGSTLHIEAAGIPAADFYRGTNVFIQAGAPALLAANQLSGTCSISGLVHKTDGLLQNGRVFIIDSTTHGILDSSMVQDGSFEMRFVPTGTYYLKAEPRGAEASDYQPTYYVSQVLMELATAVPVRDGITEIGSVDIQLLDIGFSLPVLKEFTLFVFPNPAAEQIAVRWIGRMEENYRLDIIDKQGNRVKSKLGVSHPGIQEVQIPVHQLRKGNYTVSITTNSEVFKRSLFCKL